MVEGRRDARLKPIKTTPDTRHGVLLVLALLCTEAWGLRFKHCAIPSFSTAHSPTAEARERRPPSEQHTSALVARRWGLPEL
ncbi:hypothetical protein E2C01_047797 [Portunus trituberculatus]|uniref:Uncharacterized protein n=1 Tax=Portunus trituberculatus TaxID=210409 RepID=A0A5B7GBH2_PORTR|nr:hypothetical protein [Portunus trituberculatus]